MSRVSIYRVPIMPMRCVLSAPCVYRQDGVCDQPRVNKGNSDATCHRMNNKDLIATWLRPIDSRGVKP